MGIGIVRSTTEIQSTPRLALASKRS